MYLEYYNLREEPFAITPDPRFLYFSAQHQEAFNHLLFGIHQRKGFIELTGGPGAGKTTICRKLLEELGVDCQTALILNPCLTLDQLLEAMVMEFDLRVAGFDRVHYLQALNQFLLDQANLGNIVALIIDEAHKLTDELLEQICQLSDLETDHRKLMQIVLMGQSELREKLARTKLSQRFPVRYHLGPLCLGETADYVNHRLTVAGANGQPRFDEGGMKKIFKYSGGNPRLINAICDKALTAGFVYQTDLLDKKLINMAVDELQEVPV